MEYTGAFNSPIGTLEIRASRNTLTSVRIVQSAVTATENEIIAAAKRQLDEYFDGRRQAFDIPLDPRGTPFQLAVWEKLSSIPYGKTESYSGLAALLGGPALCRAVGNALNKNPIMIFIPCHRIIGKDGALTGFASGLDVKRFLLTLEKTFAT
jgi:methylated-DNA-[protein]-cysteine S-methyltransferase